MTLRLSAIAMPLMALVLAGCGATTSGGKVPPPVSVSSRLAPPPVFRPPPAGDPVLGQNAAAVSNLLGHPRLDLREGAGRKLQFTGNGCVVDVYFYAPRAQGEPIATHIDARGQDGRDADKGYCISAMAKR
jgi:hypothetical protein